MKSDICLFCKLRVGDYCFCSLEPEKIIGEVTKCDYYFDDNDSTYYEFIDGFQHCDKLKKEPVIKQIEARIRKELNKPKGEWIFDGEDTFKCSVCNTLHCCGDNFCPHCGADMRGNKND